MSVLIRQIEQGLGARLFDRTTRSLAPTQAAREAIVVAERVLRDVDSLGEGLRDLLVTTAREGIDQPDPAQGQTWLVPAPARGLPEPRILL